LVLDGEDLAPDNVRGFCLLPMQMRVAHQFGAGHFDFPKGQSRREPPRNVLKRDTLNFGRPKNDIDSPSGQKLQ